MVARRPPLPPAVRQVVFAVAVLVAAAAPRGWTQFQVSVSPHNGSANAPANSSNGSVSFTVTNMVSDGTVTYYVQLYCTGATTNCTTTNYSFTGQYGASIPVTFSTTSPGSGTVSAKVYTINAPVTSDSGWYNVTVLPPYQVVVTPKGTATPQRLAGTSGYSAVFTVQNTGYNSDTYSLSCRPSANVGCTRLSLTSVSLGSGASATDTAYYNVGSAGTGTLTLRANGSPAGAVVDTGYYSVPILVPQGAPVLDATPYNYAKQDYHTCAVSCFALTTTRATVPYFSLDAPRNVTLAYNSDRVSPQPFVLLNVSPDTTYSSRPTQYQLQVKVKWDGVSPTQVTFLNGEQALNFAYPANTMPIRIGGQFAAAGRAGTFPMDILVSAYYASGAVLTNAITTKLVVWDGQQVAQIARGWNVGGVERLFQQNDGSALVVEGDGSTVYFYFNSQSGSFVSPAGEFSQLVTSTLSGTNGWARLYPDSTQVVFNNGGVMTRVLDRFGNRDSIVYDNYNRVSKILDPLNIPITLTYGANGLASVRDSMGRVTTVTVDANGRLTAILDPDGIGTRYGYDASLRLDSITDRRGATTVYGYDANSGKLATITAPAVPVFQGGTLSPVTTLGAWQQRGVPYVGTSSPPGFTAPRADTVKARLTDAQGYVTVLQVDRFGGITNSTDPLGRITKFTRDTNSLVVRDSFPSGGVDSVAYNSSGLPTFEQPAGLSAINFRYAAYGQPDSIWGSGRLTTRNYVGTSGRIDSVLVGGQSMIRYTYDAQGRVLSTADPQGHLVQHTYAGTNGNLSRDSLPGRRITTYLYDAFGRDTVLQRPQTPLQRTHFDALNRTTQVYDGVNTNPTSVAYDSVRVRSVTDPKGQVYGFTFNALGWMTQRTDPAGRSEVYLYDLVGDLKRWVNRRGDSLAYNYDGLRRRTSKSGTNTTNESWSYSTNGLVITTTSPADTETAYFNVFGRADSVKTDFAGLIGQAYWRRTRYTTAGRIDSVDVSGGGIGFESRKYVYNTSLGTLTTIRLAGRTSSLATNLDLQDTSITFPASDRISRQYYTLHGPTQLSTGAAYNLTIARSVGFDSLGRISMQVVGTGGTGDRYTYDGLSRLLADSSVNNPSPPASCTGTPPPTIDAYGNSCVEAGGWSAATGTQFAYDAVGNRTDNGGTYGPGNRITAFGGCTYGTDNDGNTTSQTCGAQVTSVSWTGESRLASVASGGTTVAFQYDPLGRLVRKDLNGSPQSYFLWDGFNLLAELTSTGTGVVAEYSYYPGLDHLHALIDGGHQYNAHADALGNVIALTDSAQAVKRTYQYDAWGNLTNGADNLPFNNADRARWKGALWLGPEFQDLYYMRNRWYDVRIARFLSEDPMALSRVAPAPQSRLLWDGGDLRTGLTRLGTGDAAKHRESRTGGWRDAPFGNRGRRFELQEASQCGMAEVNPYLYAGDRMTVGRDPSGEQTLCLACWGVWVGMFKWCASHGFPPPCESALQNLAEFCAGVCSGGALYGGDGGDGGGGDPYGWGGDGGGDPGDGVGNPYGWGGDPFGDGGGKFAADPWPFKK